MDPRVTGTLILAAMLVLLWVLGGSNTGPAPAETTYQAPNDNVFKDLKIN